MEKNSIARRVLFTVKYHFIDRGRLGSEKRLQDIFGISGRDAVYRRHRTGPQEQELRDYFQETPTVLLRQKTADLFVVGVEPGVCIRRRLFSSRRFGRH